MMRNILALLIALSVAGAVQAQSSYPSLPALGSISGSDLIADYPSGGPLKKITATQLQTFISGAFLIAPVTNAQLATMPTVTIKCNATGGTATPTDCTATQVNAFLGAIGGPASSLTPGATIGLTGDVTATGVLFTGSSNINLSASIGSGSITAAKLASGAAVSNIGYPPVNRGGDTMSGPLTVISSLSVTGAAGVNRGVNLYTGANLRWQTLESSTAEGGANAGSDFLECRYSDAGGFLDCPFQIVRSTGAATLFDGLTVGGVLGAAGGLTVSGGGVTFPAGSIAASYLAAGSAVSNLGFVPAAVNDSRFNGPTQNSQSASYTLVANDQGRQVYHPSADTTPRTWTVPANGSVPYAIGVKIDLINDCGAGTITIPITTDTMVFFPTGATGTRTLAACGEATLSKVTATRWVITGVGLT